MCLLPGGLSRWKSEEAQRKRPRDRPRDARMDEQPRRPAMGCRLAAQFASCKYGKSTDILSIRQKIPLCDSGHREGLMATRVQLRPLPGGDPAVWSDATGDALPDAKVVRRELAGVPRVEVAGLSREKVGGAVLGHDYPGQGRSGGGATEVVSTPSCRLWK